MQKVLKKNHKEVASKP